MAESGQGKAQAVANYGVLGASARATMTTIEQGGNVATSSVAQSSFADSLTFTGLTGSDFLEATISLSGSSSFTGTASSVQVQDFVEFNNGSAVTNCVLTAVGMCTAVTAIGPGVAVAFNGQLDAGATAETFLGTGTASANYLDTGIVDSLKVVDANGDVVEGVNIIAASGTDYNSLTESTAPEPSSLTLLAMGVLGIGFLTRPSVRAGGRP